MNFSRPVLRWSFIAATVMVAMGIAVSMPTSGIITQAAPPAAPAQQVPVCTWRNLGNAQSESWGGTSAYNANTGVPTGNPRIYGYSGVDGANKYSARVEEINMTGTSAAPGMTSSAKNVGAKETFGAACAYRDKGDTAQSAMYCIGGTDDIDEENGGKGTSTVQRWLTKAGTWEQNVTVSGSIQSRYGAQAEYDPIHDVIWVTGGINNCPWFDSIDGSGCSASSMATGFLSFDDAAGTIKWETIGNPLTVYGHAMVYVDNPNDPADKPRMIIIGGSSNGKDGKGDLKELDLSGAMANAATLKNLSSSGTGPSVFYGTAAYDSATNVVVAYGGVTKNYMTDNETTDNTTRLLNLNMATATWQPLSNVSLQDRVGGIMEYDTKQKAAVFALGRRAVNDANPVPTPPPPSNAIRTVSALVCTVPPTVTPVPPTRTPGGTEPTETPGSVATATPTQATGKVCDNIKNRVPNAVINDALVKPDTIQGWGQLCNPNVPPSPVNVLRTWLTLQNPSLNYHPIFNSVVYSCGCR